MVSKICERRRIPVLVMTLWAWQVAVLSGQEPIDDVVGSSRTGQPNVVIFFIDDLGYMDLGCNGSEGYQTPRIDALAARSVRFTQFYSANPVCSPTRAALMTGKAPHRLGITQWINQPSDVHLPLEEVTFAEAFSEAGYRTGYIGKWHLGERDSEQPDQQGFDWIRCVNRAGAPGSYFYPFRRGKRGKRQGSAYWDVPDLADRNEGDYLTDEMTDMAIEFIQAAPQQPFLLCFSHYAVHTPIQAPETLVEQNRRVFDALPALERPYFEERNNARSRTRQDNPTYAAMVENLDANVGRVLDQLRDSGLAEDTLVVFTSDNGGLSTLRKVGPTSCRPFRAGKGWTYEGGIRIPTLISWPGKIEPSVSDVPGITMDLYPTMLELADLRPRPDQHLDGVSLVSALRGQPSKSLNERFLAWTYPHHHGSNHSPSRAIRRGDWKLIKKIDEATPDNQRLELYNLADDISESKDLFSEQPDRARALEQELDRWLERTTPPDEPSK